MPAKHPPQPGTLASFAECGRPVFMVRRTVMPRRARLFDDRDQPTWIVAENPWHKIMEVRALPSGTDLMRAFLVELLRYQDAGWRLNEFSAFSAPFTQQSFGVTRACGLLPVERFFNGPSYWRVLLMELAGPR